MAGLDWQLVVSLVFVGGATLILLRAGVRLLSGRSEGGCGSGGCGDCSVAEGQQSGFVPLQTLERRGELP